MDMMERLTVGELNQEHMLPCPFCGSKNVWMVAYKRPWVKCLDCGSYGPSGDDANAAVKAWNRRPALPIGRCKDCKHQGTGDSDICHSGMSEEFCRGFESK